MSVAGWWSRRASARLKTRLGALVAITRGSSSCSGAAVAPASPNQGRDQAVASRYTSSDAGRCWLGRWHYPRRTPGGSLRTTWRWVFAHLPIACADVLPVQRDPQGVVRQVGLIRRALEDQEVWCQVGGRVHNAETTQAAAQWHLRDTSALTARLRRSPPRSKRADVAEAVVGDDGHGGPDDDRPWRRRRLAACYRRDVEHGHGLRQRAVDGQALPVAQAGCRSPVGTGASARTHAGTSASCQEWRVAGWTAGVAGELDGPVAQPSMVAGSHAAPLGSSPLSSVSSPFWPMTSRKRGGACRA